MNAKLLQYLETLITVGIGVALLIVSIKYNDQTIHDTGVLVLGYSARALVAGLGAPPEGK